MHFSFQSIKQLLTSGLLWFELLQDVSCLDRVTLVSLLVLN